MIRQAPLAAIVLLNACCPTHTAPTRQPITAQAHSVALHERRAHLRQLVHESRLHRAVLLTRRHAAEAATAHGGDREFQSNAAALVASTWLTIAPSATPISSSTFRTLDSPRLWHLLNAIGVKALNIAPVEGTELASLLGTTSEYRALVTTATRNGVLLVNRIPADTGRGPDWQLAVRGYGDYPGLYKLIEIRERDWHALPVVAREQTAATLDASAVAQLRTTGYHLEPPLPGTAPQRTDRTPGWAATGIIEGFDGKQRRWVYLSHLGADRPLLNWIDPRLSTMRVVAAELHRAVGTVGSGIAHLSREILAVPAAVELVAAIAHSFGAFTFHRATCSLDGLRKLKQRGADLAYDHLGRLAYHHALVTGDARFLRLVLKLMQAHGVRAADLVHALQSEDGLPLDLTHFSRTHRNDRFSFRGSSVTGAELAEIVRRDLRDALLTVPHNRATPDGIECTTTSVAAAALGLKKLDTLRTEQKTQVRRLHLLLALYNAFQPGVFAISGWDLVGALPRPAHTAAKIIAESTLPRATALYGSLPRQLARTESFASQLRKLLALREQYRVSQARRLKLPRVRSPGLLVLVHALPDEGPLQITAINFGRRPVRERVRLRDVASGTTAIDLMKQDQEGSPVRGGLLALDLGPYEGKALLMGPGRK